MKTAKKQAKTETPEQEIERLKEELAKRESTIAELESEKEKLINELIFLRRQMYGRSSERFISNDPNQFALAFDGVAVLPQELDAKDEERTITYTRNKENASKPVREAISEHLRREEVVIEPDNIPEGSVRIGEEVTEKLEYIPGEVYVKRIVRPKYAKPQGEGVVIADLPSQVLPRSNAGASLLAHLLVSKYQDHIPFYRQLDIFLRQDVHLPASTVNDWFADAVDFLRPLYETLKRQILSTDYIQIDESTIPVVDKDKPGSTRKGYHWIVKSPWIQRTMLTPQMV